MKIILGDNQFFGINHFDLEKGVKTESKFDNIDKINEFIKSAIDLQMDGFMINSNKKGYELILKKYSKFDKEIHYSIPYPHKYASIVNENGMLSLFSYAFNNTRFQKKITSFLKFIYSKNIIDLVPLGIDLEVPSNLKKGSYVYLQNIITDLLIGMGREDIIFKFIDSVVSMGYKPGIITLNPVILDKYLHSIQTKFNISELIVCFNFNSQGFNVFPSLDKVEKLIDSQPSYRLMAMSIFASGAANINNSIDFIKKYDLDYVVFGSSSLKNIESNINLFKNI